MELMRPKCTNE